MWRYVVGGTVAAGAGVGGYLWWRARRTPDAQDDSFTAEANSVEPEAVGPPAPVYRPAAFAPTDIPPRLWASTMATERGINNCPPEAVWPALRRLWTALSVLESVVPLILTSGYRCPELNAAVGGVSNSAHLAGRALDVVPKNLDIEGVAAQCDLMPGLFRFVYPESANGKRWIHLEVV